MYKNKTLPRLYFAAFIVALSLLTFTTVLGARAVPNEESDPYQTNLEMYNIGIYIQEKAAGAEDWEDIAKVAGGKGNAFSSLSEKAFETGADYENLLRVYNSGSIDEYVRVVVYKYWVNEDGSKDYKGDAGLIELNLSDSDNWIVDEKNSTNEKTILFYKTPLAVGASSDTFLDGLKLSGDIKKDYKKISEETTSEDGKVKYTTIIYDYAYNGKSFKVEVEADGVQTHHADDAIKSAWGRDVTIAGNGELSLN